MTISSSFMVPLENTRRHDDDDESSPECVSIIFGIKADSYMTGSWVDLTQTYYIARLF